MISTGRAVATVAREFGIDEATSGRWLNAFKVCQDAGDGALSETERAELARLRKENSELKMDRAFPKGVTRLRPGSEQALQMAITLRGRATREGRVPRRQGHAMLY